MTVTRYESGIVERDYNPDAERDVIEGPSKDYSASLEPIQERNLEEFLDPLNGVGLKD